MKFHLLFNVVQGTCIFRLHQSCISENFVIPCTCGPKASYIVRIKDDLVIKVSQHNEIKKVKMRW